MSLPKRMALAAGIPGADLVPHTSELFLGFTSTQKAGLGPTRIANFETLGYTNAKGGYFEGGTHLALSHIFEDLEAWYLTFDFRDRVDTTFDPGMKAKPGAQTLRQGPRQVASVRKVKRSFEKTGTIGHSASLQTTSRLLRDTRGSDGTLYPKGTAIPHRADFNTLDNPFAWSAQPQVDGMADGPKAGVHFVVFNPTSDDFKRNRLAMDGVLPDGHAASIPARRPRAGSQLGAADYAPAELPRPAAPPPLLPAGGASGMSESGFSFRESHPRRRRGDLALEVPAALLALRRQRRRRQAARVHVLRGPGRGGRPRRVLLLRRGRARAGAGRGGGCARRRCRAASRPDRHRPRRAVSTRGLPLRRRALQALAAPGRDRLVQRPRADGRARPGVRGRGHRAKRRERVRRDDARGQGDCTAPKPAVFAERQKDG